MQPIVALNNLSEQEKEIVGLLLRAGRLASQVTLRGKMRSPPASR